MSEPLPGKRNEPADKRAVSLVVARPEVIMTCSDQRYSPGADRGHLHQRHAVKVYICRVLDELLQRMAHKTQGEQALALELAQ